jgi:hypothetical protein
MNNNGGKSLKEHRCETLKNYLSLERFPKWMGNLFVWISVHAELPITLLMELVRFLLYEMQKTYLWQLKIHDRKLYLGIREQRLKQILGNAHIKPGDVTIITIPLMNSRIFDGFLTIPLLSCVSAIQICKAFVYSIQMSLFMAKKYGKTDVLFRSYSAFDFFLACFCFGRLDNSNEVIYTSTYSRWGYLFANLSVRTTFLQHGMLGSDLCFLKKTGCPDIAFFLNEEEKVNCCKQLFTKVSESHFLEGLKFTSNEKLLNNGKVNVLIVCNLIHFDKEEAIVRELHKSGAYNVYIKPHPLGSYLKYEKLGEEIPLIILLKIDYPKVDMVISYKSTLAIEYRDAGVKVIWHDDKQVENVMKEINNV